MTSRILIVLCLCIASKASVAQGIDGFITSLVSPVEFYLGSTRVTINAKTTCGVMYLESDITLTHNSYFGMMPSDNDIVLRDNSIQRSPVASPCTSMPWDVGQRVHVVADPRAGTDFFQASSVIAYSITLSHHLIFDPYNGDPGDGGSLDEGHTGALLEEKPQLSNTEDGWTGSMWLDGYRVSVTKDTSLLKSTTGTHLEFKPKSFWGGMKMEPISKEIPVRVAPDATFSANTWAAYRGDGFQDGQPYLERVQLWPNQVSPRERRFIERLTPTIIPPDYAKHIDGRITFASGSDKISLSILADDPAQVYVRSVGEALIPHYQLALSDTDPTKIHFQFFVVQQIDTASARYFYKKLRKPADGSRGFQLPFGKSPAWNEAAFALPDGLIMISLKTLSALQSEAELASLLSYSITLVLQKQSYLYATAAGVGGGDIAGATYERAMRIGIRQLYLDGYDIRDAPGTWAHAQGKQANNPVIGSSHPDQSIPWYEAYAFDYISNYYRNVDYSKLKRGDAEYQEFLGELRKADPEAFAAKK